MSNYYDLNGIKSELKKRIDKNESFLQAWKNVEFCSKKDGKPFKNMQQNIINAKYDRKYSLNEYKLTVYTSPTSINGYMHDSIDCYKTVNQYNENDSLFKNKPENIKNSVYHNTYVYDIDDIKQAVNDHIIQLEKEITELKKQLDNADIIYTMFKTEFTAAMDLLDNICKQVSNSDNRYHADIYYMIKDLFFERFPYC